ncbi:cysteine desulfurase SufS [Cupriavidus necator N-1]|uniref:Cysteine desulfurase n=1 Tax=Cupriavidus necator (strain ATCC 43291 / DSM 13513 / CCUG 52238 / LMG 8453 / N-1) TaxID=1042878 RepID=F8GPB2_CUPNN|nr:cysteine desulfurase [Cupriavidus necator]AEI80480.1 cysteine desulfurase SufS [Cupriavidus necator N-1]MDX6009894.1 cysteine desulfurase [Cupriavidus necator]
MNTAAHELMAVEQALTVASPEVERLRQDFPILRQTVNGKPLVYLDNAATTQKPQSVIDSEAHYYGALNANIHRGVHTLSQRATDAYEAARDAVRDLINAAGREEIVFVRGTTEAINLVAATFGQRLRPGDEILISAMEHHSNIVPWQLACQRTGALLQVAPINDAGELMLEQFAQLLGSRTRLVALTHLSNALGTVNPVRHIIELAHFHGIPVLIDGAQAVPHLKVDVQALDCDFYAFSGHKLYGPTGVGVLYGKAALLDAMPPYQGGGDMIREVTFRKTTYNGLPYKFEAGTPNIAGVIALGAAIRYVRAVGLEAIAAHEHALLAYAGAQAARIAGLRMIGTAADRASILSFTLDGIHPHDVGTILDQHGVAVRAGHHCAMPVMERFGVPATVRASFALYNTREEVDALFAAVRAAQEVFA